MGNIAMLMTVNIHSPLATNIRNHMVSYTNALKQKLGDGIIRPGKSLAIDRVVPKNIKFSGRQVKRIKYTNKYCWGYALFGRGDKNHRDGYFTSRMAKPLPDSSQDPRQRWLGTWLFMAAYNIWVVQLAKSFYLRNMRDNTTLPVNPGLLGTGGLRNLMNIEYQTYPARSGGEYQSIDVRTRTGKMAELLFQYDAAIGIYSDIDPLLNKLENYRASPDRVDPDYLFNEFAGGEDLILLNHSFADTVNPNYPTNIETGPGLDEAKTIDFYNDPNNYSRSGFENNGYSIYSKAYAYVVLRFHIGSYFDVIINRNVGNGPDTMYHRVNNNRVRINNMDSYFNTPVTVSGIPDDTIEITNDYPNMLAEKLYHIRGLATAWDDYISDQGHVENSGGWFKGNSVYNNNRPSKNINSPVPARWGYGNSIIYTIRKGNGGGGTYIPPTPNPGRP